ncbi:hypothetical protein O3P69_000189 [Scylla paramamosain]|uniref:Uncharacterized protein n=1 Tax=Scylla paramamosain TaxID=85552 RepID=A0AAW0UV14_SCYPA
MTANTDHPTSLHINPHTSHQARARIGITPVASTVTRRDPGMIRVTIITVKRRAGNKWCPLVLLGCHSSPQG